MIESPTVARVVLTTTSSQTEAESLARILVEEQLAACATLLPTALSIYRWKGRIESANETLLLIKTTHERIQALESRLRHLHSFDTPEFLVLTVDSANRDYLEWLQSSVV